MIGYANLAVKLKYFLLINSTKDTEMNKFEHSMEIDSEFTGPAKQIGKQIQYIAGRNLFWASMRLAAKNRSSRVGVDGYNEESARAENEEAVKMFFANSGRDDVEIATEDTTDYVHPEAQMAQAARVIQYVMNVSAVGKMLHCPPYEQGRLYASALKNNRKEDVSDKEREREESKLRDLYGVDFDAIFTCDADIDESIRKNRAGLLEYLLKFGDDAVKHANNRVATEVRLDVEFPDDWDDICNDACTQSWEWLTKSLGSKSQKTKLWAARVRNDYRMFELV